MLTWWYWSKEVPAGAAVAECDIAAGVHVQTTSCACCCSAAESCENSSVMFGAPWIPTYAYYIQESAWKTNGNISKVNVYSDPETGCLVGIKPTYGWKAANARRLGIEKVNNQELPSLDLKLQRGEYFSKAQYKFGR